MTLTITDTDHDQRPDPAHRPPGPGQPAPWQVSWLPGQALDRNSAITAMTLAELAADATCTSSIASGPTSKLRRRTRPDRTRRDHLASARPR